MKYKREIKSKLKAEISLQSRMFNFINLKI